MVGIGVAYMSGRRIFMKRLFVLFTVLFVSLNFIACAQKKDSKTRLQRGAGRTSQVNGAPATGNGWSYLSSSTEVQLYSQDSNMTARAFLGDGDYGYVYVNSVVMKIRLAGNQVDGRNSRIGFRFYDNQTDPLSYYVGPETGATAQGVVSGNNVNITFDDGGTIEIRGYINGNTFSGSIYFDGGNYLGDFSVPVQSVFYQ